MVTFTTGICYLYLRCYNIMNFEKNMDIIPTIVP